MPTLLCLSLPLAHKVCWLCCAACLLRDATCQVADPGVFRCPARLARLLTDARWW